MISAFYEFTIDKNIYKLIPFNRDFLSQYSDSNYQKWFHDPIVTQYNSHGLFPYTNQKMYDFLNSLDDCTDKIIMAIVDNGKDKHIGNVSIQSIDWINRSAEFAIIIGETDYYGKGIGTEACQIMLKHGFNKMNLNRIWTGTSATNIGMNELASRCNFIYEGTHRAGMYLEGHYVDVNCYGILKKEWIR